MTGVAITNACAPAQEYADKALLTNMGDIAAFVELHIEQGPSLEAERLQIGIIEAIMAPSLVRVQFSGRGGHGGGMPMSYRCRRSLLPPPCPAMESLWLILAGTEYQEL